MSLIHDALRKAQREANEKNAGAGAAQAPQTQSGGISSPSEVTLSGVNFEEKGFFQNKRNLVLVATLVLVACFAFYRFMGSRQQTQAEKEASGTAQKTASTTKEEADKLKRLAVEAYRVADLDESWAKLTAASSITQKDPEVWNNLGVVLRKRGDLEGSRKAFEKALALNAQQAEVLNNLAVLDIKANDFPSAQGRLAQALQLKPNYPEAVFHTALVADLSGEKQKASEYYKQFLANAGTMPPHILDQVRDHIINLEK